MKLNTFSICARCEKTNQIGIAIATAVPKVRYLCPYIAPGVGAVVTQSYHSKILGTESLKLLNMGIHPEIIIKKVLSNDKEMDYRQLGIVDIHGNTAAWTGRKCSPQSFHLVCDNVSVQGNLLKDKNTISAMFKKFQSSKNYNLTERLMLALEEGSKTGGDKRGGKKQSANLIVYSESVLPLINVSIDKSENPVAELRKTLNKKLAIN